MLYRTRFALGSGQPRPGGDWRAALGRQQEPGRVLDGDGGMIDGARRQGPMLPDHVSGVSGDTEAGVCRMFPRSNN